MFQLYVLFSVTSDLKLLPSAGSDRAWVWNPQADYADEEAKPEQLAIRFANAESECAIILFYCLMFMGRMKKICRSHKDHKLQNFLL